MECKICNKVFKGKIGLNTHLRIHKIDILEYYIKYENLEIPKCACGKICARKGDDINFGATCGDLYCIKKQQREKRLLWFKNNPEKTAWRLSNMSFPERIFKEKCEELNLHKTHLIIRERSVYPYFIDFAFENEKVAVEIDGSQHQLEERKKKDEKKDQTLISNGWRVLRFTAKEIQFNTDFCFKKVLSFITGDTKFEKVGIFEPSSLKEEQKNRLESERKINGGFTNKELDRFIRDRTVVRPSYDQLINEINEFGYSATGRKYSVSDNAIRRWVKSYQKFGI